MDVDFQLLDCDYFLKDNKPILRLFGKTKDGKTACAFYEGFLPYFYVLPKKERGGDVLNFLKERFSKLLIEISSTKKFLPIGLQNKRTKLLKITLRDPSQVPAVRDELLAQDFVDKVFEADILFKYRFMSNFNLSGMKWVRASGKLERTGIVKTMQTITASSIRPIEKNVNVGLKYLAVDIEVIPKKGEVPDSKTDSIAMISLSFYPKYKKHGSLVLLSKQVKEIGPDLMVFKNESEMLEELLKIIDTFDPDIIVGYNINNFDFPFVLNRLRVCKISRTIGRCEDKQAISKKFGNRFRNVVPGRIVVDVYELIKESVGKGLLRLKRYGLGDVSKELLNESKLDIAHSEIGKYWDGDERQIKKLIEYARKDSDLALKLLLEKNMLDKFIELSRVSGLLLQDVLDGGEATRVENLLLREFNKLDFIVPCKPSGKEVLDRKFERETKALKGALVLEPVVGLHTNSVVYLDFKSMYPSIFVTYNICPTTLLLEKMSMESIKTPYGTKFVSKNVREGIIPRIVRYLMKERENVRDQMKKAKGAEKRVLDARQYALKIMTNAFYGYTGYTRARLYFLDIANAITSCGRFLIQKTRDIVETEKRFKVIYGDTDSIMVETQTNDVEEAFRLGKEIERKINKELAGTVQMKIENVFKTLLVLTKKRYAGISLEKTDGEWKERMMMKGIETIRRDWCDLVSETLFKALEIILKEQNPKEAFNYVKDVLGKLQNNQIPIDKLIITKSVSKPLKSYKGTQPHIELVKKLRKRSPATAPGVGDRVGFVIVQGLQLISNRAEDPEYVKQHGLKIDSKYYLESQLLPPLERVFEAIGIGKTELIGVGKQLLLADAIKNNFKKPETHLTAIDGFICNKCNKTFRRIPLIGKCPDCSGEILFYSGQLKSRYFGL